MTNKYSELNFSQRYQIQIYKSANFIASELCVHRSTVYRELKRNSTARGTLGLNANILATDINTKLANITARADIIIGYTGREGTSNNQHLCFRNDAIKSVANNFPAPPNFENTYFSCVDNTPRVRSGLLNKKIGDEERIKSLL